MNKKNGQGTSFNLTGLSEFPPNKSSKALPKLNLRKTPAFQGRILRTWKLTGITQACPTLMNVAQVVSCFLDDIEIDFRGVSLR